jgi:hypothetical protein
MASRGPHRSDDAHALEGELDVPPPFVQEAVKDRVEVLLRGVPRLRHVVVEADLVDGVDGGIGVGIGGQEDLAGLRE